jgi:hypothetical protein
MENRCCRINPNQDHLNTDAPGAAASAEGRTEGEAEEGRPAKAIGAGATAASGAGRPSSGARAAATTAPTRRAGRLLVRMGQMVVNLQAARLRRRADRLSWLAETRTDQEQYRDVRVEVDRLRGTAARVDARARLAGAASEWLPRRAGWSNGDPPFSLAIRVERIPD